MKHAIKSIACVLVALAITLTFFGCMAEKNMVTDGIEKFNNIAAADNNDGDKNSQDSDSPTISKDKLQVTESSDGNELRYTYSFNESAGNSKITLLATADKKSKEFIESSVWFVGRGQDASGNISQATVDNFCEISKYSVLAFTELSEADADAIIKELKVSLPESYNGKTSFTKDVGNYRFGFSSSSILTGFTIKNIKASANSSQEDVTAKPAQ